MPTFNTRTPTFKKKRDIIAEWKTFRKGLNILFRATELGRDEMAVADNIMLVGSGVPTGRWGTVKYFTANATGSNRGFGTYKSGDTNEILALTDEGYIAKKNGTGSTVVTGQSYPSGTSIHAEQLGGKTYFVSPDVAFTEYDGTDLTVYPTISPPTGVSATNFSGATGSRSVSYKVVAISENGGSTTPSDNYVLTELPDDLSTTQIHIFWSAPSTATLRAYEVYRGNAGDETLLATVGGDQLSYVDSGLVTSGVIEPPITNSTGGVKSSFIAKYKDRLLVVPADDKTKLMISARYPDHTKFNWADGGGFLYIDPDSGDDITGVAVQPIADRIVVYKNYASHLVELKLDNLGNFSILNPQYQPISTSVGCSSQDTIATVENDTFYFGRNGIYVTGYEPNFLNVIRTNEVSARIRPFFENLSKTDYDTACAFYVDNKYILSFPYLKKMICYDRERGSFAGIWDFPFGVNHLMKYVDGSGTENWVVGVLNSNQVYKFSLGQNTDDGTSITKTIRLRKEDFKNWSALNIIRFFYVLFRSIVGTTTVNILVEDRAGSTSTVKSFTITGSEVAGKTGYGMNQWGLTEYGLSEGSASVTGDELTRWGSLFKQARLVQIEITTSAANSNFELLKVKLTASEQTEGSLSATQRV